MRWMLGAVLVTLVSFPLGAQSPSDDELLDGILAESAITWEQASWLVGRALGTFDDGVTPSDAAAQAVAKGWAAPGMRADRVTLADYGFLLARAGRVSGGFFYTLFPGGRYALRELVYRRIVPPGLEPDAPVSGTDALTYLQNFQAKEAPL